MCIHINTSLSLSLYIYIYIYIEHVVIVLTYYNANMLCSINTLTYYVTHNTNVNILCNM